MACTCTCHKAAITNVYQRHSLRSPAPGRTVLVNTARSLFWGDSLHRRHLELGGRQLQQQKRKLQQFWTQKRRTAQTVRAAIFGVGAPEALLVGVVALVVFGPKGLAQAVKSLGATFRAFSPTIREIASVTNELSSTLQEQIGLDEIRNEFRNPLPIQRNSSEDVEPTPASTSQPLSSSELSDVSKVPDEDIEAKIAESKQLAWGGQTPEGTSSMPQDQDTLVKEPEASSSKMAAELSIQELEAELRRRREASTNQN